MVKRKRKCSLLAILVLIIVLFILTMWRSHQLLQPDITTQGEKFEAILEKKRFSLTQQNEALILKKTDVEIYNTRVIGSSSLNAMSAVFGVATSKLQFYLQDSEGMFTCIDGTQRFNISSVNDDYCDCHDGSDEPGTGACPNTMFYCSPQKILLPSSRINDGICDCCDGSDEWKQLKAGHILYYSPTMHYSPCRNFCSSIFN